MKPEEILYVLINIYVNSISARKVAEEVGFSRNTVNTYKKNFADVQDDVVGFVKNNPGLKNASPEQLKETPVAMDFILEHDIKSHLRTVTYALECEIKEICEEHLNCYIIKRSRYDFACKMLNYYARRLYNNHWKNWGYDCSETLLNDIEEHICEFPESSLQITNDLWIFGESREHEENIKNSERQFKKYNKDVSNDHYYLRKPHSVPKNYDEVYEIFKLKYDGQPPIKFGAFYEIASKFWLEGKWEYNLFEDLKCVDSDDEKKK